jgi:hypothetical protein
MLLRTLDKFRGIICTFYAFVYFLGLKFRGIICTFYAFVYFLGLKTVKNSLNICWPHAGRKLSAPQQKQSKSVRAAPHAAKRRSRNLGAQVDTICSAFF